MNKAVREAKVHSSWININAPYERGVEQFITRLLGSSVFLADLRKFVGLILMPGIYNSLSQLAIKATIPGVPDFYQGTELWDLALVDPDNRRPVDYAARQELLGKVAALDDAALPQFIGDALANPGDGALKLLVAARALRHRRASLAAFERGAYVPLAADGPQGRHVVAFARSHHGAASITVAGRFFASLPAASRPVGPEVWSDTRLRLPGSLPTGPYRDVLSGNRVNLGRDGSDRWLTLGEVFSSLPVAILTPV
jgi:(1->4)-alpha-D-glucan 1-alpha-D-glucosylmutase